MTSTAKARRVASRPYRTTARRGVLAIAMAFAATAPAAAHPHVFVDASATFVVDERGRLGALRITHRYDALVSLFLLEDLGVDPFAPLTEQSAALLADAQGDWLRDADGFAALSVEGRPVALQGPTDIDVSLDADRVSVEFTLALSEMVDLKSAEALLSVYDPVYLIDFTLAGGVTSNGPAFCQAGARTWTPTAELTELKASLSRLPFDADPDDPNVGRNFAAKAWATCR